MRTRIFLIFTLPLLIICIATTRSAFADNEHGPSTFHVFQLETEVGASRDGNYKAWDFEGWIGGDENKLWIYSEGNIIDNTTEKSQIWAYYSRNISEFWDAQVGLAFDAQPYTTTYLSFGFVGLAPYFFETEAHLFLSEDGDLSSVLRFENEILLTQKLIFKPYLELNLQAQDVSEKKLGEGLSNLELGVQLRYAVSKKLAPYFDLHYESKIGETSSLTKNEGENVDDLIMSFGVLLRF